MGRKALRICSRMSNVRRLVYSSGPKPRVLVSLSRRKKKFCLTDCKVVRHSDFPLQQTVRQGAFKYELGCNDFPDHSSTFSSCHNHGNHHCEYILSTTPSATQGSVDTCYCYGGAKTFRKPPLPLQQGNPSPVLLTKRAKKVYKVMLCISKNLALICILT